jgi:sortase A
MAKYYYKRKKITVQSAAQLLGIFLFVGGLLTLLYIFLPLISWQIYFAPVFAQSNVLAPIPKAVTLNQQTIQSLIRDSAFAKNFDSEDAQSWFPKMNLSKKSPKVPSYTLSIPKLHIDKAVVSTLDYDIGKHLINYGGTAIPGDNGNSVIIGHSTLPQLFNPKDYHTIFANAYQLSIGDEFFATVNNVEYRYKIDSIRIVDPDDTSAFAQWYDNSYITIDTCTPPGTTWKRLVIKAVLQKI